jgi:hypothetical protein
VASIIERIDLGGASNVMPVVISPTTPFNSTRIFDEGSSYSIQHRTIVLRGLNIRVGEGGREGLDGGS